MHTARQLSIDDRIHLYGKQIYFRLKLQALELNLKLMTI